MNNGAALCSLFFIRSNQWVEDSPNGTLPGFRNLVYDTARLNGHVFIEHHSLVYILKRTFSIRCLLIKPAFSIILREP